MSKEKFFYFLRRYVLFIAIASGTLLYVIYHNLTILNPYKSEIKDIVLGYVPVLICITLYISFCKVEVKKMRPRLWHILLIIFQVGVSFFCAYIARFTDPSTKVLLQAFVACTICPTAAAAAVITGKLGGSESSLTTYTIISNLAAAIFIPLIYPLLSSATLNISMQEEMLMIGKKVFPMMTLPLILALFTRYAINPLHTFVITKCKDVGLYIWATTLTIMTAQTLSSVVNAKESTAVLISLALVGLLCCAILFSVGKGVGNIFCQRISAGQGLGQKNMGFGIWVTLEFMPGPAAIACGIYILWQNLINSYQLIYKARFDEKRRQKGLPPYQED